MKKSSLILMVAALLSLSMVAKASNGPTMIDLGALDGSVSSAFGINNQGQVAGESTISNGETRAFLWEKGGMTNLGTLGESAGSGYNFSVARGINNRGQVVGESTSSSGIHAFLWQPD